MERYGQPIQRKQDEVIRVILLKSGNLRQEQATKEDWSVLLQVNATLLVQVDELVIINEPSFPVIELMVDLISWNRNQGFEYRSMEADVSPLLFIPTRNGFYVASPLSGTCSDAVVEREELVSAVDSFIGVIVDCAREKGIRLPFSGVQVE